jgi:hypothetical protein
MRIFTTGNVAIGTTTDAGFRLDVNGTARVQGNAQFGTGFYWDNTNGRLGIGTSTPAFPLDVQGIARVNSLRFQFSTYAQIAVAYAPYPILKTYFDYEYEFSFRNISTGGGTPFIIHNTTNNIGINTTTDAGFRLDVNGTARVKGAGTTSATTAFTVQDSAGTNRFEVFDNGRIYMNQGAGATLNLNSIGGYATDKITITRAVVGSTIMNASAILQADSTIQGFLPPRQTQAQRTAIASPAVGLIVYQTDLVEGLYIYKSTGWTFVI